MEFRLLGQVEVEHDGRLVAIGRRRERCLLGLLLLQANKVIAVDRLIDLLWDGESPAGARAALRTHVCRLRAQLDPGRLGRRGIQLVSRDGGYLVEVDPHDVDAHRFRELMRQARAPGSTERAAVLRRALALWRGPLLADVASPRLRGRVGSELIELRMSATELLIDELLETGQHRGLASELFTLVAENPHRERFTGQLMLALYRTGRYAEAMSAYQRLCERLAEDLGADPGRQLRDLYQSMLRREPALDAAPASASVPRQLPGASAVFAGRKEALAQLEDILTAGGERRAGVRICCVSGMAGVGKTTLAVHWAHSVADRFPDGQLYVDLRGFDPGGVPVAATDALRRLLDALDVPAQRIPDDLDGQVAVYRSHMASRRMLVVLDNARDVEQVRPLLPGSSASMVVVTSRDQLSGLIAAEGAVPLTLDLLAPAEAYELLADRLGATRLVAEPRAVEEIVVRCGRLPLALAVAAARVAVRPDFPLAVMADELSDAMRRLDVLDGGHPVSDVRAALAWSYQALGSAAARLLRLLALHEGPEISAGAAASLAGVSIRMAHVLLAELARAHLVAEDRPGRYGLHDLVRLYAAELAAAEESDPDRRVALHRVLDHYVHTAHAAASLLSPHREAVAMPSTAAAGVTVEELHGASHALAWFTAERAVLLTAIRQAAAQGFDAHAWQLAWTLTHFLHQQGHWQDQLESQHTALAAAQRLSDRAAQASSHRHLGRTYARLGRSAQASSHLLCALDLFAQLGNRVGQGYAHRGLCMVLQQQERHAEALRHARQALELFRAAGHEEGEASSLNAIGWYHAMLDDHTQAIAYCQQAIALFQRIGNRGMEGTSWDSLGYAHHRTGDATAAIRCYQRALDLLRETGEHFHEAESLVRIADSYRAVGEHASAREALRQALAILDRLGHQDAGKIRAKLDAATDEKADRASMTTMTPDDRAHRRGSPLYAALP